ncbi:MAG: hypothetical protein ACD_67C00174G0001 [uncultured bacterium]|nr:MAG: hypothetical protein ACD_67C00174G0001 [uncultured bacterium]
MRTSTVFPIYLLLFASAVCLRVSFRKFSLRAFSFWETLSFIFQATVPGRGENCPKKTISNLDLFITSALSVNCIFVSLGKPTMMSELIANGAVGLCLLNSLRIFLMSFK